MACQIDDDDQMESRRQRPAQHPTGPLGSRAGMLTGSSGRWRQHC